MQEILAIALRSMHQDTTRLEHIGMNLANAMTPGYKRSVVSTAPGFAQQVTAGSMASPPLTSDVQIHDDVRAGSLRSTGQPLDLALTGPGHFEIQTPGGLAYTRHGEFRVDGQGRLVTTQGNPVMGLGGEIFLSNPNPRIDSAGRVFDTGPSANDVTPIAQLKLVSFEGAKSLHHLGNGLLMPQETTSVTESSSANVKQGFLESSNVNSMQEMVQLIQTMRHFESMQRVAVGYDEMIGGAIRKLGEMS